MTLIYFRIYGSRGNTLHVTKNANSDVVASLCGIGIPADDIHVIKISPSQREILWAGMTPGDLGVRQELCTRCKRVALSQGPVV